MDWKKTIFIAVLLVACFIGGVIYKGIADPLPGIGQRSNSVPLEEQVLNQLHIDAEKAEAFAAAVHGRAKTLRDGADEVIKDMRNWYRPAPVAPPAPPRPTTRRTRGDAAFERRVERLERGFDHMKGQVGELQSDMRDLKNANQSVAQSIRELNTTIRARTMPPAPPGPNSEAVILAPDVNN